MLVGYLCAARAANVGFIDADSAQSLQDGQVEDKQSLYDRVHAVLVEHTELTPDEIEEETQAIVDQYDGLVHPTGALYLLAFQHNTDPNQELGRTPPEFSIEHLQPDMSDITIEAKVERIQDVNQFDGGQVRNIVVSDDTGRTQLTLWNEDVEVGDELRPGDVVCVEHGYTKESDWCFDRYGCPAEIRVGDGALFVVLKEEKDRVL